MMRESYVSRESQCGAALLVGRTVRSGSSIQVRGSSQEGVATGNGPRTPPLVTRVSEGGYVDA